MQKHLAIILLPFLFGIVAASPVRANDIIQVFNVNGFFEGGSIPVFSGATISAGSTITIDATSGNIISANVMIPGYSFDSVSGRAEENGWFYLALTSTSSSYPLLWNSGSPKTDPR